MKIKIKIVLIWLLRILSVPCFILTLPQLLIDMSLMFLEKERKNEE